MALPLGGQGLSKVALPHFSLFESLKTSPQELPSGVSSNQTHFLVSLARLEFDWQLKQASDMKLVKYGLNLSEKTCLKSFSHTTIQP